MKTLKVQCRLHAASALAFIALLPRDGITAPALDPSMTNRPAVRCEVRTFQGGKDVNAKRLEFKNRVILTSQELTPALEQFARLGFTNCGKVEATTMSGRQLHVAIPSSDRESTFAEIVLDVRRRVTSAPTNLLPSIDIIPYVRADGTNIQLTILPTIIEFLGYEDSGTSTRDIWATGGPFASPDRGRLSPNPEPLIRRRQTVQRADVADGQTIMIYVQSFSAKAGRPKPIIYLITPRLIDAAGNPIHGAPSPRDNN